MDEGTKGKEVLWRTAMKLFQFGGTGELVAGLMLPNWWYVVAGILMIIGGSMMEAAHGNDSRFREGEGVVAADTKRRRTVD